MKGTSTWQPMNFAYLINNMLKISSLALFSLFFVTAAAHSMGAPSSSSTADCLSISAQPLNTMLCGTVGSVASISIGSTTPAATVYYKKCILTKQLPIALEVKAFS